MLAFPAGLITNFVRPAAMYSSRRRCSADQSAATSSEGSRSGRRLRTAASTGVGQFTVADREVDSVVIRFDLAARCNGSRIDVVSRLLRLGRRQEAAQPTVAEGTDPAERRGCRPADPDIERQSRFRQHIYLTYGEEVAGEGDVVVAQRDA